MTRVSTRGTNQTVLIADDEPGLVELYGAWLTPDWNVRLARTGVEALSKFDDEVDVVIVDQQMPQMNGDEVAHHIRTSGSSCSIGMVTSVEPRISILDWPLDEYVQKPIVRSSFRTTVEQLAIRAEFEACVREYFGLGSKLRTLRATTDEDKLRRTEAYNRAVRRLEELHDDAEAAVRRLDDPAPVLVDLLNEFGR